MKKFFIFLGKLLWASFLWFLVTTISMIVIAILDPLSGLFIIIPELGSEISPFALVHIIVVAQVCIYYTFCYSSESTRSFSKKYGLSILAAYITSFSIYFIDTWVSFYFILWPWCIFILAIYFLYFLWKEIAPKIRASDSYKLFLIEYNKHGICRFIWMSILEFDLLWFWESDKPLKQKLAQFLGILLYVVFATFLFFLIFAFIIKLPNIDLFQVIASSFYLEINWSSMSLQDAIIWMHEQKRLWIDWRDEYGEIYKWENNIYLFLNVVVWIFSIVSAFILGVLLKNRKQRLLSLILLTIISGTLFGIYIVYYL